jgi:Fic family protein
MKRGAVYSSDAQKVELIERNLIRQHKRVVKLVAEWSGKPQFSCEVVRDLHRIAMEDIYACAGHFRKWSVATGTHRPPKAACVEGLVEDLCERANDENEDLLRIAAYVLWKFNWIHPFGGGNGRTSRAVASLLISVRLGYLLPGRPTLARYVDENRAAYLAALRDADASWGNSGVPDVRLLQSFLDDMLRKQLGSVSAPKE